MKQESNEELEKKLKNIGLKINTIPNIFKIKQKIRYKPLKSYDNINYKVYHFVDIKNIEIYLTKATRLDDVEKKYRLAQPLMNYLRSDKEELLENYIEFVNMLKDLNIEDIKKIEQEQKEFQENLPFMVKYKDNFIWEIYYSELDNKYFMMFSTEEKQISALFYLIKKQIELQKSKKTEMIYVPINNKEYTNQVLKKSEIADLENYLWYFTKNWPSIYEIKQNNNSSSLQILGTVHVYDKIKSNYKIQLDTKEEAQEQFKLIKALFILKSHAEEEYNFQTGINKQGGLNFYFNHYEINYQNLAEFIKREIEKKKEKIEEILQQNLLQKEKLQLLKTVVQKQNLEYLAKEKQIVTFLECKKTFFGKISYFFKFKKKKTEPKQEIETKEVKKENVENVQIEQKEFYTLEDLIKVCTILQEKEKENKNQQMDIKALENKKENLERKIKNATLYINEIESHKKSIFDFWKFTNKDEVSLLVESKEELKKESKNKISKVFFYEEDIEEVGKKIDVMQRKLFNNKECDAIFAIHQDLNAFQIDRKEKKLKKDEIYLQKSLKEKQKEYEEEFDEISQKDFDIFGNIVEDKTKIKILNNEKHREIKKDKFKILDIHPTTTLSEYQDNIHHYAKILEDTYNKKMVSPYDMPIYMASLQEIEIDNWHIMEMNAKKAIQKFQKKEDSFILNKINIKENMPVIFYSNIMFFENLNKTLPEGMDIVSEVLIDLQKYEIKLVGRKDFNINFLVNEFENKVKTIQVYEYDIEKKKV